MTDDYAALLKRARSMVPENVGTGERFQMPVVDVQQEGKTTIVRNLQEILVKLNRTSDHLVPILLRELGTAGSYDGGRLVLQTKLGPDPIQARLQKYVETYVICGECGRPDTHLVKDDRTTVVKCDACGAHRPVKAGPKKQAIAMKAEEAVVEGKIYEVMCEDRGQRGDGIARRDRYTIFVKGGEKGKVYHVKIQKVTGTLAFADVVPAPQGGQQTTAAGQGQPQPPASGAPAKK